MTWDDWLSLAIVVLCLLLSAFLSSSETGLTAASRAAMRRLQGQGNPRAEIVNELLAQRGRMLGVLALGSNVLIVAASSLVAGLLAVRLGQVGVFAAIAIMALVVDRFRRRAAEGCGAQCAGSYRAHGRETRWRFSFGSLDPCWPRSKR